MSIVKKLLVAFVTLGLVLNGFCVNLLFSGTAMAKPMDGMDQVAFTYTPDSVQPGPAIGGCNHGTMSNYNCCLVPLNHVNDKAYELKPAQESRSTSSLCRPVHTNLLSILKHIFFPRLFDDDRPASVSFKSDDVVKRE